MRPRIEPCPATGNPPDVQQLLDAATAGARGAANIFRTLAHHPGLLRKFLPWAGKLLAGGELPAADRELAILRVAWRCGSDYEWGQHVRIAGDVGVTDDEIARVRTGPDDPGWTTRRRAILAATDELLADHRIGASTWDALAAEYDDQQLIELTMVVGNYVMIAGMLNSVGVEREPGVDGF